MPLYTDTDSIIVRKEQYEKLLAKGFIGDDFGKLKLEKILDRFESYGKKMYAYNATWDCKGHTGYGFRLKGVRVDTDEEAKRIFEHLANNSSCS